VRWLAGLLVLAAALLAWLLFATSSPRELETSGPTAVDDAHVAQRSVELSAAPATVSTAPVAAAGRPETSSSERETNPRARVSPSIQGRVRRADGTPAVRALVGLFAPAPRDDGVSSPFAGQFPASALVRDRFRTVRRWTGTDEQGGFTIEDPEPGTWIVRAEDGPLLAVATEPFGYAQDSEMRGLELQLPPEAWLEGNLILQPGTDLSGLCLEMRAHAEFSIARWMHSAFERVDAVRALIPEDATFRLGPVESGLVTVGLVVDPLLERRGRPDPVAGGVAPLVDLYLPVGITRRDIDVRAGLPGSIGVTLSLALDTADPARRTRETPTVRVLAEPIHGGTDFQAVRRISSGEPQLEVVLGPLAPGAWRVVLRCDQRGPWSWILSDLVEITPGSRNDIHRSISLGRVVLTVLDEQTGAPLEGFVEIGRRTELGVVSSTYPIRPAGALSIVLPPGEYMVTAREDGLDTLADDPKAWTTLVWDDLGPRTTTLRVPR
jgi:hypothetical protein